MPRTRTTPPPPEEAKRQRVLLMINANEDTRAKLGALCRRRAGEYAARGLERRPDRLASEVMIELIHRAYAEVTRADAATPDRERSE